MTCDLRTVAPGRHECCRCRRVVVTTAPIERITLPPCGQRHEPLSLRLLTREERAARFAVCEACKFFHADGYCTHEKCSGCARDRNRSAMAFFDLVANSRSRCPVGKWPEVSGCGDSIRPH